MEGGCNGSAQSHIMDAPIPSPLSQPNPQSVLLDTLIPGFSLFSVAIHKYVGIDLQLYIPAFLILGLIIFAQGYIVTWLKETMDQHLMSTADIRVNDEIYNMVMAWISKQKFAKKSRRFVANTNIGSPYWWIFGDNDNDENEDGLGSTKKQKKKEIFFTPSFGTHHFWYKGYPFIFRRTEDQRAQGWGSVSERENISISCFGRNPELLKDLLDECRTSFAKRDENKTVIYRGGLKSGTSEPSWTRAVSRVSRPFSTVVLDAEVKQKVLDDMTEYLNPVNRRWYSNRGIPYRRGYLLFGPPGTGKSSLSFAIAGHFNLTIYIVSLNSMAMNEENLGTLFAELPQRCVVLLEDIDTAGLTHTREEPKNGLVKPLVPVTPGSTAVTPPAAETVGGRISLSALLNIIDGVAATEGRILIMTTNHLDKLDDALIRPGRVDMTVKFDLATTEVLSTIFRSIFATLEGDFPDEEVIVPTSCKGKNVPETEKAQSVRLANEKEIEEQRVAKRQEEEANVLRLSKQFAEIVPTMTHSPAEVQGYLLRCKRDPVSAVAGAADWVSTAITEKKKQEREEREKEERDKAELVKAEKERLEKEKETLEKERQDREKATKAETEAVVESEADADKDKDTRSESGDSGVDIGKDERDF